MWNRYWFAPGGRYAAAMVRIALGISVLMVLDRVRASAPVLHPELMSADVYRPCGLLLLFPSLPPRIVIELAGIAACAGALAMILGAFTRVATAVTAIGAILVTSQAMSYQPSWSHDLSVVLIALLAFLGARGGDALAVDGWLRRLRGRAVPVDASYQWSLRLAQVAVGLMFVSAGVLKLKSGGLHWALSDNLRHQLLARYDLLGGVDRPAIVDWLLARSWRYETAAMLNLVNQLLPVAAIVFASRPWVRGLAAFAFVLEVAALYVVMELGNPSWFPLAAVFIDWDALGRGLARRPRPVEVTPARPRGAQIYVVAFVLFELAISFVPRLDGILRTFPFSRFPMFAIVRAKEPYDVHQTYELIGGRIAPITTPADRPIEPWIQAEIDRDYVYRTLHREHDVANLRARMVGLLGDLRARYPQLGIRGVRVYVTTYQVPAYPAEARLHPHDLGILGELVDDRFVSHLVPLGRDDVARVGGDPAITRDVPLALYRDGLPAPEQPTLAGDGAIALPHGRDMLHVVATLPGPDGVARPYLLARRVNGYW